ncbi:VOC family protein [Foetidibacter luteolus]|uniref:VOC family protein n=1 Tax=Foetidibacter luteolus TaxID=2608880 RepID=UPI00129A5C8D|nr:VOC family protein [Foetidibacter luteolus]
MELKLIVIRTGNPSAVASFYSLLGFVFSYHKHGNSPYHYSAIVDNTVFEVYPLQKNQDGADGSLRLGFGIDNFDTVIKTLQSNQVVFASEPCETDFGYMAVISDPDGRKIELYKK